MRVLRKQFCKLVNNHAMFDTFNQFCLLENIDFRFFSWQKLNFHCRLPSWFPFWRRYFSSFPVFPPPQFNKLKFLSRSQLHARIRGCYMTYSYHTSTPDRIEDFELSCHWPYLDRYKAFEKTKLHFRSWIYWIVFSNKSMLRFQIYFSDKFWRT